MGTTSLYRSLGTSDKAVAKRLLPAKLLEVQHEVAALTLKYFPDDDAVLAELAALIQHYKAADDHVENRYDISEKDITLDAMVEFGNREKSKRLKTYKGTPQFAHHKEQAEALKERADDMVRSALDPRHSIRELVEHWRVDIKPRLSASTKEEYERAITRFLAWCQKKHYRVIDEIDRKAVRAFVTDCYQGVLGKTVKIALGALRGVWNHAFTIGWTEERSRVWDDHSYAANVRIGTGEKKAADDHELPFSFDDIRTILTNLPPTPFRDVYRLGLICGARSSEMVSLKREHVRYENGRYTLDIKGTKTASANRTVPIPLIYSPFMARLTAHKGKYLIPLYPDKQWPDERERNSYINKELNRKRRLLGLPDDKKKGVHSTRRTFVEMMEGAEIPLDTTKLLIGHARSDLTHGLYSKGSYVDLSAAMDKLKYPADITDLINKEEPEEHKGRKQKRKKPRTA